MVMCIIPPLFSDAFAARMTNALLELKELVSSLPVVDRSTRNFIFLTCQLSQKECDLV